MEFETDWKTLGKHRVRQRATRGFPTETVHTVADVARLAIENNMSARARLVEVVYRDADKVYDIFVGTTMPDDRRCAAHLEVAMATVLGLLPEQLTMTVITVEQREIDLNFGVYERLLLKSSVQFRRSSDFGWNSHPDCNVTRRELAKDHPSGAYSAT